METYSKEFGFFKGIKDDGDIKDTPLEYFYKITNYNYPDLGTNSLEKILMPEQVSSLGSLYVDGMFEYRFLDSFNKLQIYQIGVCGGNIYKDILTTPILLKSGISRGKCTFSVLNDKLYIANGKDYIFVYDGAKEVVSQMGAPIAEIGSLGVLSGTYYWAMTYINAGGEEILGSISNTVTVVNKRIILNLPIGYDGTTSRKIYRTINGGTELKLLTTIGDNTTLTYIDNAADNVLSTVIGIPNNELPKPYFIGVFNERLIGATQDLYPTQVFITDPEIDIFDLANGLDIANYSDDNSPVSGLGIDFSNIVIATKKHFYLVGFDTTNKVFVTTTRVNIGCKDGYSMKRVPTYGNFQGGLMFVSTNNDVRVLGGLRAIPVATSVDNIYSDNFSQDIKGSLGEALIAPNNIYAEYFNYRYHLVIDGNKFIYDIRVGAWTYHNIQSESYKSIPMVLAVFNNILYNGQTDGWIEQEYKSIQYKGEEVVATLESGQIAVAREYKFFQKFAFWFVPSENNEMSIEVIGDDDKYFTDNTTFSMETGAYSDTDYSSAEYEISDEMDFKVFNVYRPVRWIRFILKNTKGNILFKRWSMTMQSMTGKE